MSRSLLPLLAARLARTLPALAIALAVFAAPAQAQGYSTGRVAAVTERQGSVVFAPAGQDEWTDLPLNRPLTQADRLWTDAGGRVELHMGDAQAYLDGQTNLGILALDERTVHLSLTQGTLAARVGDLRAGERFEVGTPNVAVRGTPAASWRLDVSPDGAGTRVTVNAGRVSVYGEGGRGMMLGAGQAVTFVGRNLQQGDSARRARDGFDRWVAEHVESEDDAAPTARSAPIWVPPGAYGRGRWRD